MKIIVWLWTKVRCYLEYHDHHEIVFFVDYEGKEEIQRRCVGCGRVLELLFPKDYKAHFVTRGKKTDRK